MKSYKISRKQETVVLIILFFWMNSQSFINIISVSYPLACEGKYQNFDVKVLSSLIELGE